MYKLGAVRDGPDAPWERRVKLSEQAAKVNVPGILQVRRFQDGTGRAEADVIYDEQLGLPPRAVMVDPLDSTRRREVPAGPSEDLLVPVFRRGRQVYAPPPLDEVRARTQAQLARFHGGVKRFVYPHQFPVGLERGLHDVRTQLIREARKTPA